MHLHLPAFRRGAAAFLLAVAAAQAPAADFLFAGSVDSGPLPAGTAFSGGFSIDGPTADADGDMALTAFSLVFGGQSWTLAALDGGAVAVFSAGTPLGLALSAISTDLAVAPAISFVPGFGDLSEAHFSYRGLDAQGELTGFGSYTLTDVTPAVPEPGAWALLLGGWALVARASRGRRAAR